MHFKHFWVPCLHIIFFTSRLECSRKLNEKMKWNSGIPAGIPAAASRYGGIPCRISKQSIRTNGAQDFHSCDWRVSSHLRGNFEPHLIRMKKSSYQTWLESIDQKCGEKSAFRIKCRVSERSQVIKISFFYAAAPQNSCRKYFLYVIGFEFVEKYSYQTN